MKNVLEASDEILDILRSSVIDGSGLTLQGQLDRKSYEAVNKFLVVAGAKWDKRAKRHVFASEQSLDKVRALLATGKSRDDQKHFQHFFTPPELAARMVEMAELTPRDEVLEPSAGRGAIVAAILAKQPHIDLTAIEFDSACIEALRKTFDGRGFSVILEGDFLKLSERGETFTKIIMNPPFTHGQDVAHIDHALAMLKPNGKLVAICANGPRQKELLKPLVDFCDGTWEELPAGTFEDTGVRAVLLSITKEAE